MDAYRHHAFLSYAWADDQPFDADGRPTERGGGPRRSGWVSTFHDRLCKHLGRALGRSQEGGRIWIDYEQMRGADGIRPTIVAELAASTLLLPVLSRAWFASRWCREEFAAFVDGHDRPDQRLFPVWMEPVAREDLDSDDARAIWDRLRALLCYRFWYHDADKQPRTLWFPHMDPTQRRYGDTQQDMARDLARRLKMLARPADAADAPSAPRPVPAAADPGTPPEPIPGEHLVMIQGGSHDAGLVQAIADALAARHGLGYVIPLIAQRNLAALKPSAWRRDLRETLRMATCVLVVFRAGPPHEVHEQLRECMQAAARRPERPPRLDLCHDGRLPLTFRPPGVHVHPVAGDCTADCVRAFVAGLRDGIAP